MSNPTGTPESAHPAAAVTAGQWVLDPAKSAVTFRSKTFWGIATVTGVFTGLSGSAEVLADGSGHGTLTVESASLDTKNAKRDTHLRSADFFAADEHPTFTFTATSVTPADGDTVTVTGELTIRGTARPLTFPARVTAATADSVTLDAETAVTRGDFGMTWNQLGMLKDPAKIAITAHFTRSAA